VVCRDEKGWKAGGLPLCKLTTLGFRMGIIADKLWWLHRLMHTLERFNGENISFHHRTQPQWCIMDFDHLAGCRERLAASLIPDRKPQTRNRLPKTVPFCNVICFTIHFPMHFGLATILDPLLSRGSPWTQRAACRIFLEHQASATLRVWQLPEACSALQFKNGNMKHS
jgi:hypothetical protein